MISVTPVLTRRELECEQIVGLAQEISGESNVRAINVARIATEKGHRITFARFLLTDKERELITKGADLIISQPHIGAWQAIGLQIAFPGEYPFPEGDLV